MLRLPNFRSEVSEHPVLKLAKYITLNEDKEQEEFWRLIFRGQAAYRDESSQISDKQAKKEYKDIIYEDLLSI